jgi:DNA-binding NarL/FixJ family response regulator
MDSARHPIRVILADDHALVRAGFRALLEQIPGVQVLGEAPEGHEALKLIAELRPDIALLDISMPGMNGLEVAARVAAEHPQTRVILLSMHVDQEYVRRAMVAGAAGYLVKNAHANELRLAVEAVARGDTWLSPPVSNTVAALARGGLSNGGPLGLLTPRQREVLQLVAEGHSTKEIAHRLGLSVKTVETHRTQLMEKLDIHGVAGLVRCAIKWGLVPADQ